jgi:hypothetical protein
LKTDLKPTVRFFAQECLVILCLGCIFLDKSLVLEALYEYCIGDSQYQEHYGRFCDRLDSKKVPFLIFKNDGVEGIYKLKIPLSTNNEFLFPELKQKK